MVPRSTLASQLMKLICRELGKTALSMAFVDRAGPLNLFELPAPPSTKCHKRFEVSGLQISSFSGWAVRVPGWLFLQLPIELHITIIITEGPSSGRRSDARRKLVLGPSLKDP